MEVKDELLKVIHTKVAVETDLGLVSLASAPWSVQSTLGEVWLIFRRRVHDKAAVDI